MPELVSLRSGSAALISMPGSWELEQFGVGALKRYINHILWKSLEDFIYILHIWCKWGKNMLDATLWIVSGFGHLPRYLCWWRTQAQAPQAVATGPNFWGSCSYGCSVFDVQGRRGNLKRLGRVKSKTLNRDASKGSMVASTAPGQVGSLFGGRLDKVHHPMTRVHTSWAWWSQKGQRPQLFPRVRARGPQRKTSRHGNGGKLGPGTKKVRNLDRRMFCFASGKKAFSWHVQGAPRSHLTHPSDWWP